MEAHAEWVTARPTPALRPVIDDYVGYRVVDTGPGVHRGLPSRHMTFVVSIGPGIDVISQTDPLQPPDRYGCVVSGLQVTPALIAHQGYQEGVAVELTPLGARTLLGMPARELWNTSVEFTDVVGATAGELWERLQPSGTWPERFAICDEVLGRLARDTTTVSAPLRYAWHTLVRSGGTAPVAAVADRIGWTRQHLTRTFGAEFGLGPKLAARVIRFERARRMIAATPPFVGLAQVAAACGYFDQAHLNRDFAELAGCSPRAWLADEGPSFPSFQDDPLTPR